MDSMEADIVDEWLQINTTDSWDYDPMRTTPQVPLLEDNATFIHQPTNFTPGPISLITFIRIMMRASLLG